ncbi:hypothetical protein [Peptoniphilus harei]
MGQEELSTKFDKDTESIKSGEFFKNSEFKRAIDNVKKNNSSLHLIGLVSKGGVHSHLDHLKALNRINEGRGNRKNLYPCNY